MFTSWKTTLAGVAAVVLAAVQATHDKDIVVMAHDSTFWMLLLVGLLGFVSKDSNVTGGTKGQPSSPVAMMMANQMPSMANPPASVPKDNRE